MILSNAIALMHASLRTGQTPRDFFKSQSTNWSLYPGTQYSWKQLYESLRKAGLLDLSPLDLPATRSDAELKAAMAEYWAAH